MNKGKLKWLKFIILALCLIIVFIMVHMDNENKAIDETYFMYAEVSGHRINVFKSGEKYYLFLPSFLNEEDIEYSFEARKHDIDVIKSDGLASVFITTNSGSLDNIIADKNYKESGKIKVYDKNGSENISVGLDYMKGRGNYSWTNWDKKSFKIKLSKNKNFLDLGEGQDYALIANASDATLIRNHIARELECAVEIPFASTGRFVDLYVNGDYMGNYYLCPSIEVGTDRVDITNIDEKQSLVYSRYNSEAFDVYETPLIKGWNLPEVVDDITGGYLLEREFGDRYTLEYGDINNGFITDNEEHFIVIAPQYCTKSEINYISDFVNKAENEILTGENLGQYINLESFAKRYLVEEVVKNYDGGVSSAYYYKDSDLVDSRFTAGPGWDFDMSLGNYLEWMDYANQDATGITRLYTSEHSTNYFKQLLEYNSFNELVKEYFETSAYDYMEYMVAEGIDEYEDMLSASAYMDSIRWGQMYEEKGYSTADTTEYQKLKQFIADRIEYLKGEWVN
ncbi:MAG: CotH kinase family protein [Butyrivibrio sp.]|nr:CotH kinase family protein [Butyrivibrio sp.]